MHKNSVKILGVFVKTSRNVRGSRIFVAPGNEGMYNDGKKYLSVTESFPSTENFVIGFCESRQRRRRRSMRTTLSFISFLGIVYIILVPNRKKNNAFGHVPAAA